MSIVEIHGAQELDALLARNDRVVLDFTANWCGPCKKLAPLVAQLASIARNVVFCKVDVDQNEELQDRYSITEIPAFVFLRNGQEVPELKVVSNNPDALQASV